MDSNSKILIADENPTERARLREGLSRAGWHFVDEASNGEEALIKLTRGQFDAALIDMMLTRLDGIGVVRNAKKEMGDRSPFFLMVFPVTNQTMIAEAVSAGADLCLMKPFDIGSLCEHLRRLMKSNGAHRIEGVTDGIPGGDMETQVTKIIHQIGVPAHIKGYQYLRTAILLTVEDSDIINSVTKVLYPSVAQLLFRLYHPAGARETDQQRIYRHDCRQPPAEIQDALKSKGGSARKQNRLFVYIIQIM